MTERKLYAIGDIHGCSEALKKLLPLIEEDRAGAPAKIVFLGDYIDRGPDSPGVIEQLITLKNNPQEGVEYVFLKGNHEDLLEGYLENDPHRESTFLYNGGGATINQYQIQAVHLGRHRTEFFMDLETIHQDGSFVFVHAGIDPFKSLLEQSYDDKIWSRDYVKYDGDFYHDVFVVHGHTPVEDITIFRNQMNIDTGCVFGKSYSEYGKLTAVRLDDRDKLRHREGFKIFQTREYELINEEKRL